MDREGRRQLQEQQRAAKALLGMQQPTIFLVVRHGETEWNKEERLQGQLDPGLNDVGVQQAAKLAEHFQARQRALLEQQQDHAAPQANGKHPPNGVATIPQQPVSAVWSSDLSRAAQTAGSVAKALGMQVQCSSRLRERRLGALEGVCRRDAPLQHPAAWHVMVHGPHANGTGDHACTSRVQDGEGEAEVADAGVSAGSVGPPTYGVESVEELQHRVAGEVDRIAALHPGQTVVLVTHGGCIHALHLHATGRRQSSAARNGAVFVLAVQAGGAWAALDWGGALVWQPADVAAGAQGGGEEGG